MNVLKVFAANMKGSSEFTDMLEYKLYRLADKE